MSKPDLTIHTESEDEIYKSFERIANDMLNNFIIKIENSEYRIISIEFYYYNQKKHPDCNAHQNKRQLLQHQWYLHKNSINPNYNRKGIDYTFGHDNNFGGILIKKVQKISGGNIILSQSKFIDDLVQILKLEHPHGSSVFKKNIEDDNKLLLQHNNNLEKREVLKNKRVNLAKPAYCDHYYAFSIKPQ